MPLLCFTRCLCGEREGRREGREGRREGREGGDKWKYLGKDKK